jgi:hypothetical protein
MTKTMTLSDYELVSAYLDGACSPRERVFLEERFGKEPELAQTLLEFKHVRRILRLLPVRRAPRNFTLSASQVPARPQHFFWAPALNYVGLASTLLLVMVFIGTNFLPGLSGTKMLTRSQNLMASTEAVSSTPMIITWGQPADTSAKGGMGGGGNSNSSPDLYSSDGSGLGGGNSNPSPEFNSSSGSGLGGGGSVESATEASGASVPVPNSTEVATEVPMTMMAEPSTGDSTEAAVNPILGIAPTEEQGKVISTPEAVHQVNSSPEINYSLIEIILASIAVISVAAAFLIKKLH